MLESIIPEAGEVKPRYRLLNSEIAFSYKQSKLTMFAWLLSSVGFAAIVAAVDKTVAKSLSAGGGLNKVVYDVTGNPASRFDIVYLSSAGLFILIFLLIMAAVGISQTRNEEESNRTDNLFSGGVSRNKWLFARIFTTMAFIVATTLISDLAVWLLAEGQGIHLSMASLLLGGLNIIAPAVFLMGLGVLIYGIKPRLTAIFMYAIIVWSFTVDVLSSSLKNAKFLSKTSLFHYVSLVPAVKADWRTFALTCLIGLVLMLAGATIFNSRDLSSE
jgi:putative exporter of polyketide antibiotics